MPGRPPQVFAFSGGPARPGDTLTSWDLTAHAVSLTGVERPRVCYLPTAMGDAEHVVATTRRRLAALLPHVELSVLELFPQPSVADPAGHLMSQDLVLVEGGSVANLMAVWRVHGLDRAVRACWEAGVVLAGQSAGSLCWHLGGPTDSFRDELDPWVDGLGLLPFSNGVHDDAADQPRRASYRSMVGSGVLPAGYATENGVGLHYLGTGLHQVVSVRAASTAWWVEPDGDGGHVERPVRPRVLGA